MAITGEADGMPMKVGVAITDVITGLYAATSLLAGLYARGKGRGGAGFDLALADCALASLVNVAQGALLTGQPARRWGNAHPQIVPYEAFATADGHLVVAVGADRQWQRLCRAVKRDDWADDARFATNPARVEHREASGSAAAIVVLRANHGGLARIAYGGGRAALARLGVDEALGLAASGGA